MRQKEKFTELQEHFDIDETELNSTLEDFFEEDEPQAAQGRKLNFPLVAGLVFLITAFITTAGMLTNTPGWVNYDLLIMMIIAGSVFVLLFGFGAAGVRSRERKKPDFTKKKKNSGFSTIFKEDQQYDEYGLKKKKKLFRSSSDSMLFGVCGGIAEYFNIDPTIVRIAFAIAAIYYGSSVILYFILAFFLPKKKD